MNLKAALPLALFAAALVPAQQPAPERTVRKNVIHSRRDPAVRIELPKQVRYVGANRWTLYDVADCELHLFVEADGKKNVQRYYWIQFEAYVPAAPTLHYQYNSPQKVRLAEMEFDVRPRFGLSSDKPRPGSDLEHVLALLTAKGYQLPAGLVNVRLVHVPDEQKRKELMIIYGEDIAPTGFTAMEFRPGEKGHEQWPEIAKGIVQRAQERLKLERIKP